MILFGDDHAAPEALLTGLDEYIVKSPVHVPQLSLAVRQALNSKPLPAEAIAALLQEGRCYCPPGKDVNTRRKKRAPRAASTTKTKANPKRKK